MFISVAKALNEEFVNGNVANIFGLSWDAVTSFSSLPPACLQSSAVRLTIFLNFGSVGKQGSAFLSVSLAKPFLAGASASKSASAEASP
eukprot:8915742-Heterocapsa_arctica.AAC.1